MYNKLPPVSTALQYYSYAAFDSVVRRTLGLTDTTSPSATTNRKSSKLTKPYESLHERSGYVKHLVGERLTYVSV